MTSPLLLASNVFLAWQIGVNYHRFSSGCDLHKISKPPHAIEIHLTDLWLLGEEFKPIIIRDADKAFHFMFLGKLYDLTRVRRLLYSFPILIYLCLAPFTFRNYVPS
jgi:hypothetical protein